MRSRVFSKSFAPFLFALLAILPALALGQQPTDGKLAPVTTDLSQGIDAILRQGREFESQSLWDRALTHYEDAKKLFPDNDTIQRRYHVARMRYDVSRRYDETSFRQMAGEMSFRKALTLYKEVLLKIDTHYVSQPDWNKLARFGVDMFDAALTNDVFLKQHLPGVSPERISDTRAQIRRTIEKANIKTRKQAYDAAHWAAYEANKQLGMTAAAALLEYTCGAASSLDDYTSFLSKGELKDLYSQIRGNFVGLGIELKANPRGLLILKVLDDSPALRGGLRPRDVIVAVDGRSTQKMNADRAADLLQGPENSTVRISILSPGQSVREVSIRREEVKVNSVDEVKVLDWENRIGYFRLASFQETTDEEVNKALWKLHRACEAKTNAGMKSLIIDLRGNPGGLLNSSVDVVDRFVSEGVIVSTRGRNGLENQTFRAKKGRRQTWHVPLVVLIDGDSASASEIFAGAIRDHGRGILVGRPTYGKGSVQGIFSLKTADTGIRLTTAKFYSPKGHPFSKVGVSPDILVRQVKKPVDSQFYAPVTAEDPDIAAALEAARNAIVRRNQRTSR